jgi:hypothetical protein
MWMGRPRGGHITRAIDDLGVVAASALDFQHLDATVQRRRRDRRRWRFWISSELER